MSGTGAAGGPAGSGRPDLGLYATKYRVRRLLDRIPGISRLQPNAVSITSLIPAALAALGLWQGWWALVIVGILGRMALTVLDGHIAEAYGKKTRIGPYVNRVPQEVGDVLLLLALFAWAEPAWVCLVLAGAWLVNVLAVLPLLAGGSPQWVGPGGQPDRQAVILAASAIALVTPVQWTWVSMLLVALSVVTVALRITRTARELTAGEPAAGRG
jgi:CDP-diacylglycerol--glycerol-3-phosphate 3-phosphatidyltransferase